MEVSLKPGNKIPTVLYLAVPIQAVRWEQRVTDEKGGVRSLEICLGLCIHNQLSWPERVLQVVALPAHALVMSLHAGGHAARMATLKFVMLPILDMLKIPASSWHKVIHITAISVFAGTSERWKDHCS